jgi:tetratricopeptide (TPR) repeat protein
MLSFVVYLLGGCPVDDASGSRAVMAAAFNLNITPMWLMMALMVILAAVCIVILLLRWDTRSRGQPALQGEARVSTAALRGYALAMLDIGQTQDAMAAVRAALAQSPTDVRMRAVLGALLERDGAGADAAAEYERAIQTAQRTWERPNVYLLRYVGCLCLAHAAVLRAGGRLDAAEKQRAEALRLDPSLAQVPPGEAARRLLEYARDSELERRAFEDLAAWRTGHALPMPFGVVNGSEAVALYRSAAQRGANARVHLDLALALHSIGDHSRAEQEFKEALRLDPQDAWTHFHYGLLLWRAERVADAQRALEEAGRLGPHLAGIHGTLGVFYLRQHQLPQAEQELRSALASRPDIWALASLYGLVAMQAGRLDMAVRAFDEADRLGANDTEFRVAYAELREQMGQMEAAEAQYRLAIRRESETGIARTKYGGFLFRQGKLDQAEQELTHAVELPESEEAHLHLARLFLLERRLDEAVPHLEAGLRQNPDSLALKEAQAEWQLLKGRPTEADEMTLNLVRNNTPWASVQLVRGGALLMLNRQLEAQAALREAVRLDPDLPTKLLRQAGALAEYGRPHAALEAIGQALALRPDWPDALAAQQRIMDQVQAARAGGRPRTGDLHRR